jgi:PAS domain S-box-containing protein
MVRVVGTAELADGNPVRLLGAFQDITARVAEREALRATRERLALATESGRIGVWDLDIRTGVQVWDDRMFQLHGLSPRDDVSTFELWQRHLHPQDRDATEQAVRDAIAGTRPYDTEFRIVWDDGSVHHVRGTGRVTRDEDGRPLHMIGANWDVTEARRLETALEAERRRLADIIDATDIGTWEWNVQSGELHINRRWAAILGRPALS